jgi:hypothetical protein
MIVSVEFEVPQLEEFPMETSQQVEKEIHRSVKMWARRQAFAKEFGVRQVSWIRRNLMRLLNATGEPPERIRELLGWLYLLGMKPMEDSLLVLMASGNTLRCGQGKDSPASWSVILRTSTV